MSDTDADTATGERRDTDSRGDLGLYARLKAWFRADLDHSAKWRNDARSDFGFYASEQWSRADIDHLNAQQRAPITFNRTFAILNSVAGSEINSRQETRFIPRGTEDTQVNEVLTAGSQWMADGCDAEDEQSQAFQEALICGMGWTEARLDYEEDPSGKYIEEALDPLEMVWDCRARKKNIADARRIFRVRRVALLDARAMFPGFDDDDLDCPWALTGVGEPKSREDKMHRDDSAIDDGDDDEVVIVQAQWWEREKYWLVADPATGEEVSLSDDDYRTLRARADELGLELSAVAMKRRVFKQAFLGGVVLESGDSPCPDHFSFTCITGYRDRNRGTWFGLIRVMRDPQMWANKWLTQSLHILNSTAKGGIIAEKDAFDDQRQAEDSYARPEGITWAASGAIGKNKIIPKPGAAFPAGHLQLMEFAVSSIRDVPGVNLELLGLRDANQPGILEAQRKQAAMTVLATLFDSLRRFRKMIGRVRLYFLQTHFSDGRLIRVAGPEGARALPLIKEQTTGRYDVIVDEAPTSPNQKEANWGVILTLLPAFRDQIMNSPELVVEVARASPLPSSLVEAIAKAVGKPNPQADRAVEIAEAARLAAIDKDRAAAAKAAAQAEEANAAAAKAKLEAMAGLKAMLAEELDARFAALHHAMGTGRAR